mmetsp:Transcript_33696/g.49326  ORF Transcript_33696/g.49326 Transcript_33696/m.49326 type:complete len:96 (+) Transcript_33696:91-378(+)
MAATRQSFYSTESDHQDPAYDDDHVGRLDVIDQINQDLAGKTYFEKPKVTKEVMVATLKAQNKLLMIANVVSMQIRSWISHRFGIDLQEVSVLSF